MKLCEKLEKIRKENNITQEGLADRLGVSRQAVSKWESDLVYPDTEKLIQISKIFNISLDELVNDNVDKKNNKVKKISFMDMINNLKMKKIVSYDKMFDIKMYISYDNLIMLRENLNNYNEYV